MFNRLDVFKAFKNQLRQAREKEKEEKAKKRKPLYKILPQSSNPSSSLASNYIRANEIQSMDHETFQGLKLKLRGVKEVTNSKVFNQLSIPRSKMK